MQQTIDKYELLAEIGRGAFAIVYRAIDTTLDREVALKVLHPQLLTDPGFVRRFQQEAKTMAGLRHPHICTIYEAGEARGKLFIAMELAHGPNLAQTIAKQENTSLVETLALLEPLCQALDYAHQQGVIHRDLKPANILLDKERGPLLTDFGFARLVSLNASSVSLSGGIIGTPAYIAPEVWERDIAEIPADIYALGCIAYELLTGEVLFAGPTPMQIMRAHDQGPQFSAEKLAGLPDGVDQVLQKALARTPAERYSNAQGFWYALRDLETTAQAAEEAATQAALVDQWRTETETAMAAGEWRTAKMAVGRWLALAPDDTAAKKAQIEIEQQLAPPSTSSTRFRPIWLWLTGGMGLIIVCVAFFVFYSIGNNADNNAAEVITLTTTPTQPVIEEPTATSSIDTEATIAAAVAATEQAKGENQSEADTEATIAAAVEATATEQVQIEAASTLAALSITATKQAETTTTPLPTNTPVSSTNTPLPPTSTPTDTPIPSTPTPVPPTSTPTSVGRIAFGRDGKIYTMNPDGSDVTETSLTGEHWGAWSPDGTRKAFISSDDIYVVDADGNGEIRLTESPQEESGLAWSPDSTRIAFSSKSVGGDKSSLFIMNADGTQVTGLTADGWHTNPVWSSDGQRIAFDSLREYGIGDIYVMNADGSDQIRLTNHPSESSGDPAWSPDGTHIAFVSSSDDIYIMNADGSEVTTTGVSGDNPTWSPDGQRIAFTRYPNLIF
ncbi:MAG: protein kinase, partial [Chloroflexota bacterium]